MNQKGFAQIILIAGVVVILTIVGVLFGAGVSSYLSNFSGFGSNKNIQSNLSSRPQLPKPIIRNLTRESSTSGQNQLGFGFNVAFKGISFVIPSQNVDSTKEQNDSAFYKYGDNKSVLVTYHKEDYLLKIEDLNLDKSGFAQRNKNTGAPEIKLQQMVIGKFSGNYDKEIASETDITNNLKLIKKQYLNLPDNTFVVVNQNNLDIILDKSASFTRILFQDKKGNYFEILIHDSLENANNILQSLKVL